PMPNGSSDTGPVRFDSTRAFAHVEALAVDIGSRPAGSEAEREAALYLRDQLQGFGYEAEIQPFSYETFADTGSSLDVLSPQPLSPAVIPFEPSTNGVVEAQLVDAGIGRPQEFPADTAGKIALIGRGDLFFSDKVANAEAAGALGVIVYNDEPFLFTGNLDGPSAIPAVAISQGDGRALLAMVQAGAVSARLEVRIESDSIDSQNVMARPQDGECRLIAGGHYDSVPAGPGANDNASGTATVVEMARVLAADGEFDDVCFLLFGAEEPDLIGSARFVASLTPAQEQTLEAMLNFDMVGVGTQWLLSGPSGMTDLAAAEADELGLDYVVEGSLPGGSDHASFSNAGIPAVFLHSFFEVVSDDPNYHTAEDRAEHVQPARMAEIADLGLAMIDVLLGSR
ncbi:MAG: M20/M25/M40 family metallo-hydrolase, partial [Dehalococcoidia bacterium]